MDTKNLNRVRIIFSIAIKDILDVVKNKTSLTIILGVIIIAFSSQALPLLARAQDERVAIVYDPGRTVVMKTLTRRDNFRLRIVDSLATMQSYVSESINTVIGLNIPEDFTEQVESGRVVVIDGYFAHWAHPNQLSQLESFFEEQIRIEAGVPIDIQLEDAALYPTLESRGQTIMVALSMLTVVFTFGVALMPSLLVEEKETHTLDALLVSPATYSDVVIAKALSGMAYTFVGSALLLLMSRYLIVQWGLGVIVILLGCLFSVSIGLLLGVVAKTPASVQAFGGAVLLLTMLPAFLSMVENPKWPEIFDAILVYTPSAAFYNLIRMMFMENVPNVLALDLGILIGSSVILLGFVIRSMKRQQM
jgi:ABC-2 type transport system permease protein